MVMTRFVLSLVLMTGFITPAFAADWLWLPRSLDDLRPHWMRPRDLPPAPAVTVPIPQHRVAPTPARDMTPIRVSPGKSVTIPLERDAASIIVTNPTHASVYLDNPRLAVIVPRAPGATGFVVLDASGKTILDRPIMVGEGDAAFVRVTRICAPNAGASCVPASMYYCPDNCVSVSVPAADPNAQIPAAAPSN